MLTMSLVARPLLPSSAWRNPPSCYPQGALSLNHHIAHSSPRILPTLSQGVPPTTRSVSPDSDTSARASAQCEPRRAPSSGSFHYHPRIESPILRLKSPVLRIQSPVLQNKAGLSCRVSVKDDNAGASAESPGSSQDASKEEKPQIQPPNAAENLLSLGIFLFWGAWAAYSFTLSPNQTPTIDQYYLEKLLGLRADDGFVLNSVVVSLWNLMGLYPIAYAMLLIPGSRTNRCAVPAWPFCTLSVFFGAFALLPYFALWREGDPCTPSQEERKKLPYRIFESKITSAAVLFGVVALLANAVNAPEIDWLEFGQIIQQSRLFHVTSSDFAVLTLSAPFWMYNDMVFRNWEPRSSWGLALLSLPVVGPCLYLLLRPPLPAAEADDGASKAT